MLTRHREHDSDEGSDTESVAASVSTSLTVTRKARPFSPSRLAHMLALREKVQYKMRSKEELLRDRMESLFAQKRTEMLHSRVSAHEDLPGAMKCAIRGDLANLRRELFLGYRERLNERSKISGRNILHEAAAGGHFECVKLLCYEFRDLLEVNKPTLVGASSALHLAVTHDRRAVAALLLAMGAEVNARDRQGCTPLHLVVSLSTAKLLLKTHPPADLILRNAQGRTACEEYLHRTPTEQQVKDLVDILRQREMTRALEAMRVRTGAEEALRERELDRYALVNQNESRASQVGRNNLANLRVLVKSEEEIRKEREKRQTLALQKRSERESSSNKNSNNNDKNNTEKTLRPLQAKAALLARLTHKSSHTHKKKTKSDKQNTEDQDGFLSAVSDDDDDGDDHSDDDNNDGKDREKSLRVVSVKQLKREMLQPPVKHVVINERFLAGKSNKS